MGGKGYAVYSSIANQAGKENVRLLPEITKGLVARS